MLVEFNRAPGYGDSVQVELDALPRQGETILWDGRARIEALLPLGRHPAGSFETEATYLYDRTGGSIGSLRALLNEAAIAAIISGEELVNRKLSI